MSKSVDPMNSMKKMGDDLPSHSALKKPLVIMSLKATGFDPTVDRVIEIACIKLNVNGPEEKLFRQLNPERPISPEATKLHAISDKHVKEWPIFATVASDLYKFLAGCDLAGHRLESFDLPLLVCEFKRKRLDFQPQSVNLLDIGAIFNRFEPRLSLETAYRYLCDKELPAAQSTLADADAATDIFLAQIRRFKDLPTDRQALHKFMHPQRSDVADISSPPSTATGSASIAPRNPRTPPDLREASSTTSSPTSTRNTRSGPVSLDPEGKIIWHNGEAIFTFGKHKDKSLEDVAEQDSGYLRWIAQRGGPGGFSETVVWIVNAALRGHLPDSLDGFRTEFSLSV